MTRLTGEVEESEMDFKEPLSGAPERGSTHSLRGLGPKSVTIVTPGPASFGLMGPPGVIVCVVITVLSIASDVFLALTLGIQAQRETYHYRRREEWKWFATTILIIVLPQIVLNIFSAAGYSQKKTALDDARLLDAKSLAGKVLWALLHLACLGQLARYVDILQLWRRARRHQVRVRMGTRGNVRNLSSRGDTSAIYRLGVLVRETALLDLMRGLCQDSTQLIFQIFLLYRHETRPNPLSSQPDLVVAAQLIKIMVGLFAISWFLVTFQDEIRRMGTRKKPLTCGATNACLLWRASMAASRILAIASFMALKVDSEGGLVKVYSDNAPQGAILSFPSIVALVLGGHWFLMVIWIHAQKTTFCTTSEGGSRPLLEFLYQVMMGWVHVFCYVNVKETPSRRRMVFFYTLIFTQNTSFMVVWYLQLITKPLWLRVIVVFGVEALFIIGLSCAIGYYAFLYPKKDPSSRHS